jgi:hypothetical protein
MTPQEVHRSAVDHVEQSSDGPGKNIEVHGHPLEPEVIINVKQEPQVNKVHRYISTYYVLQFQVKQYIG